MKKIDCFYIYEEKKKVVFNTTPHPITFLKKEEVITIPSDKKFLLNARVEEHKVSADLVTSRFVGSDEGRRLIADIETWAKAQYPGYALRIIGSIIAAQAYPGQVVGMTPAPGFERVAPAEKRMSLEKFTIFGL